MNINATVQFRYSFLSFTVYKDTFEILQIQFNTNYTKHVKTRLKKFEIFKK